VPASDDRRLRKVPSPRDTRRMEQNVMRVVLLSISSMALRKFSDDAGVAWIVWETRPSRPRQVNFQLQRGWLTFESALGRRRVIPIPRGWAGFSDERLRELLRTADRVPPPFG